MSELQYLYIPLEKASLISRKHIRDIAPPGLALADGVIIGRSDNAITLRPNFKQIPEQIVSLQDNIKHGGADQDFEYLNECTGILGSQDNLWITTRIPYGRQEGEFAFLSDFYGTPSTPATELLTNIGFETLAPAPTLSNGGFENAGGGGADVFANWVEVANGGAITQDAVEFQAGSKSCKLVNDASADTHVYQDVTVVPETGYTFSMYHKRGTVDHAGIAVYDKTNAAWILERRNTFEVGATTYWSYYSYDFSAPAGCTSVRLYLYSSALDTGTRYFDTVNLQVNGTQSPWVDWSKSAGDGAIANEVGAVHGGSNAVKLTAGASKNTYIWQNVSVLPNSTYDFSFWTRGDATYAGRWAIYDVTNGVYLNALSSTEVTAATYAQISEEITTNPGTLSINIIFQCPSASTGIAYFDDTSFQVKAVGGTATTAAGSTTVTGTSSSWLQNVHRGALIQFDADGTYYIVDDITSNVELELTTPCETTHTAKPYTAYYTHSPYRSDYRANVQGFLSGMIYCTPTLSDDISSRDIVGPFYAATTETDVGYSPTVGYASIGDLGEMSWIKYTSDEWKYQDSLIYIQGTYMVLSSTLEGAGSTNAFSGYVGIDIDQNNSTSWSGASFWSWGAADKVYFLSRDPKSDATGGFRIMAGARAPGFSSNPGDPLFPRVTVSDAGKAIAPAYAMDHDDLASLEDWYALSAAYEEANDRTVYIAWDESTAVLVRYTDDDGATWTTSTGTPVEGDRYSKVRYLNGQFVICHTGGIYYGDGTSFLLSTVDPITDNADRVNDVTWTGNNWVAVGGAGYIATAPDISGPWTASTVGTTENTNFITYDAVGEHLLIPTETKIWKSISEGATWFSDTMSQWGTLPTTDPPTNIAVGGNQMASFVYIPRDANDFYYWFYYDRTWTVRYSLGSFAPLSDTYRANTFSVLDGYVVLLGTREFSGGTWTYHPRRIRWTSPGTYNDFTSTGAGTGDLRGSGAILDARTVNGRIVMFETAAIGALVPRGLTTDPWDYDRIRDDFRSLSNPVVVDELCYVIGSDGLIYHTNGVDVRESGSSFDITEYDDFDETKPIWMGYSPKIKSLIVYQYSPDTPHYMYTVSLVTGTVSQIDMAEISDSSSSAEDPRSVVPIMGGTDQRVMVSHAPITADSDLINNIALQFGTPLTGVDLQYDAATQEAGSNIDEYWSVDLRTGQLYVVGEGDKTSIKHVIIRNYTDVTDSTYCPDVIVGIKSVEDSAYSYANDTTGTIAMTTSTTITGTGTAWSNKIADGDDATTQFDIPWLATQVRVYIDSTLQVLDTDYTITDTKQITLGSVLATGEELFTYCDNAPYVKTEVGDYVESDEGWHRITAIGNATSATVDHGLDSGTSSATHYPAEQMGAGDNELKIGINKLVEGVQLRIVVIPRNSTLAPTVAKITGITIGHVQSGKKTLQATGS